MALIPLHSTSLPFFIVDVQGQQPLLLAVGNNKPLAAKLLIERGARVDSKDSVRILDPRRQSVTSLQTAYLNASLRSPVKPPANLNAVCCALLIGALDAAPPRGTLGHAVRDRVASRGRRKCERSHSIGEHSHFRRALTPDRRPLHSDAIINAEHKCLASVSFWP